MTNEKDIEELVRILDGKVRSGISRINIKVSENIENEETTEIYHHGRCDVGSPWAKGTIKNFEDNDIK